jgi:hypothetical protein
VPDPAFSDCLLVEVDDREPIGKGSDRYGAPRRLARATAAAGASAARPGIADVIVSVIFRLHSGVAVEFEPRSGWTRCKSVVRG